MQNLLVATGPPASKYGCVRLECKRGHRTPLAVRPRFSSAAFLYVSSALRKAVRTSAPNAAQVPKAPPTTVKPAATPTGRFCTHRARASVKIKIKTVQLQKEPRSEWTGRMCLLAGCKICAAAHQQASKLTLRTQGIDPLIYECSDMAGKLCRGMLIQVSYNSQ